MKKFIYSILFVSLLCGCSNIPNKSVFEDLSADELAKVIKSEPSFGDFYENIKTLIELSDFSEVQKAYFFDVTYRRLFKYYSLQNDSVLWNGKYAEWGNEWDNTLKNDLDKVDEKVAYWTEYKKEHSLDRFAKVELFGFSIYHYTYIGGVEDAYIKFEITPLEGTIEQIKFIYSYGYKIDNGKGKISKRCICSNPMAKKDIATWEIDYSERDKFDGMTKEKFLQRYDLDIEITDVRVDGKNYSLDDLNIPEEIVKFWADDNEETREGVAKLINPQFVSRSKYCEDKKEAELRENDEVCNSFMQSLKEESLGSLFKGLFD